MTDKREDFTAWAARLDFSYDEYRRRKPGSLDEYILKNNLQGWDKTFSTLRYLCQAPGCQYPVRVDECYHVLGVGNVCNLCFYMHSIVREKAFFVAAQQQDNENRLKRRDKK